VDRRRGNGGVPSDEEVWAAAGEWSQRRTMNELETAMWRAERHPEQSSTICTLMLLDTAPDWDRFVAAHDWATRLVTRGRERVLEPVLRTAPPAWVPDEDFSLDRHLHRHTVAPPGTTSALLGQVAELALAPLDRSRPLWEGHLVEGLEGGRAAYVVKLHHSLTDGLGGIQLMSLVQSRTREHTPAKPVSPPSVPIADDRVALSALGLAGAAARAPGLARRVLSAGWQGVTRPRLAVSESLRYAASVRRMLSPPAPRSPLFAGRDGRTWVFGVLECPLADLRAAGRAVGASINDAYVAALLGGIRRYHEQHGVEIEELPITMPVSLRRGDDPMGGNRFAGAFLAAPVGVVDPLERIAAVRGAVLSVRTEPALDTFTLVAPVLNRLPSGLSAAVVRLGANADLSASNVPGLACPVYMAGARVDRVFPFGPLPGVAVMAAMVSHVETACIGVNVDGGAVADTDLFLRCLRDGLAEVTAVP
jgi:WS/DGAT/MGAT family acyltransferase